MFDFDYTPDMTIGNPTQFDWDMQIMPDNCAVEAERAILNLFTASPLSQQEAMFVSSSHGWYMPGEGTSTGDVGNLLELYGIPTHSVVDASIMDLATELSLGHGIIVGVDALELWDSGPLADIKQHLSSTLGVDFGDSGANHAVLVTGIDISDPANPMVILNDSGVPNGQGVAYPMEKFMQAWQDSAFHYTATDVALPSGHIHGDLTLMNGIFNEMSIFAGSFVGTIAGLETFAATGDIGAAVNTGFATANVTASLVEELFTDDAFIRSL